MSLFYVNDEQKTVKTYTDLYEDLKIKKTIKKYLYEKNTYNFFVELIYSIFQDRNIILLDSDYSKVEIENLGISYESIFEEEAMDSLNISYEEFIKKLQILDSKSTITMYTSGTTGIPKKVAHRLENLKRNVKIGERFQDSIWGLAYNPSHIAGLQVFFQAICNLNPIIDLFSQPKSNIPYILTNNKVTNISATSTFYRIVIPNIHSPIDKIKYITFGGEKFDTSFLEELIKKFPNANIRNIYASTETGTLFTTKGDIFTIPENLMDKVKLSEENELLIHQSLLGEINNKQLDDEWFKTGDIVERINHNEFKFLSRQSEIINVGGYNVNPHEVEAELYKISFINDALVKPRSNKLTGNILAADIVVQTTLEDREVIKTVKRILSEKLQAWKVPRIIKIVDEIEKSNNGKKVRK